MEIIPSINAESIEEVKEKIKLVESFVNWVHFDISDGTATKYITWHNASDLNFLETPLNIEVHLMIGNVDRRINDWLIPKVKRIYFHLDACKAPDFVIEKIKNVGIEPGIAISPDESWTKAAHFKGKVNIFQILGVSPGPAGQKTTEETFEKIKEMRKFCPSCIIEVDGGMNKENIKKVVEAGADIIVAASAIFSAQGGPASGGNNIEKAIKELQCI